MTLELGVSVGSNLSHLAHQVKSAIVPSDRFLIMLSFVPPGYIGEFEIIDDHRAGKIVVNLTGRLNNVNFVLLDQA